MEGYSWSYALLSILICSVYVGAALLLRRRLGIRASVRQMTRLQYMQWKRQAEQSVVERLLRQAGNPLSLTAWRWGVIRWSVCLVWLAHGVFRATALGETRSWSDAALHLSGAAAWLLVTNGKASPFTLALSKWKELHDGEKNRELFMIYSMIVDELKGESRRLNLYSLLNKLKEYTLLIKPAINKGLRAFEEGPHEALKVIADEIGTREAQELCKLLADLDTTPAEELASLVDAREESYTHMLRESRRLRRKLYGSLAYAAAFLPLLIYLWNALNIAQQYVTDLAVNTNQLQ